MRRSVRFFQEYRHLWDIETTRPVVRHSLDLMLKCRTRALGAEVYETNSGERRISCHTCKSKACSSCASRSAKLWLQQISADLLDVPYAAIGFTMSDDFWELFRLNRHLLIALPTIAAGVVADRASERFEAELVILV